MAETTKINESLFDAFKLTSIEAQPIVGKTQEKPAEVAGETDEDKVKLNKEITNVVEEDEKAKALAQQEIEKNKGTESTQVDESTTSFIPFIEFLADKQVIIPSDKKYTDSEEGFAEAISDTVETKFKEKIDSLPADAKRLVELAKEGVDIREVFVLEQQALDLKSIDIENQDNLYNMVIDHLISSGYDEKEAVETADSYKDAGEKTLEKHGKIAHKFLVKKQEEQVALKIETDKAKVKASELARKNEFEAFKKEVLSTEKIGSFELDKKEREKLLDYMTKPVRDGKTQSQLDDTKENRLLLSYFRMKGFDMNSIEKKVETKHATKLKENLGRFQDSNAKPTITKTAVRQENQEKLNLSNVFKI